VEASSIQDVAERAQMSKQALMHHFPTKRELRHGVYGMLADRLRAIFPTVAGALVSRSHDRYRAIIDLVARQVDGNPDLARFVAFELLEQPNELMAWLSSEAAPWLGLVVGVIEQSSPSRTRVDAQAHLAVLSLLMLSVGALLPRQDLRLHRRVLEAALKVMHLGSHIDPG
jgi:AcrR family transcriptional regulator